MQKLPTQLTAVGTVAVVEAGSGGKLTVDHDAPSYCSTSGTGPGDHPSATHIVVDAHETDSRLWPDERVGED